MTAAPDCFHTEGRGIDVPASVFGGSGETCGLEDVTIFETHEGDDSAVILFPIVADFNREDLGKFRAMRDLNGELFEVSQPHVGFILVQLGGESVGEVSYHGERIGERGLKVKPQFSR